MENNDNTKLKWIVLAAVIIAAGAVVLFMVTRGNEPAEVQNTSDTSAQVENGTPAEDSDTSADQTADGTTIVFTNQGFANATYTAAPGATVTVRNDSLMNLQFSSDDHPAHTDEPALNTPTIAPGRTTTFTAPSEPGDYGFHDHINARFTGTLRVE